MKRASTISWTLLISLFIVSRKSVEIMKFSLWTTTVTIIILQHTVESASILQEIFIQKDTSVAHTADSQNSLLSSVGLIKGYGYPVEVHQVTTEDGYVLIFYRIPDSPRSNSTQKNKPIAFLQHGAFTTFEVWTFRGPENGLAYLLADAGYDVWLGSLRANAHGQFNRKFSILDKEYWQFSFHEHAIYDLPAIIDYVLDYTKMENLNYIGYSMGTTISYVLLSTKPSYNKKFRLVLSLAPVAYWVKAVLSPILQLIFRVVMEFKPVLEAEGIYGIVPQSRLLRLFAQLCRDTSILQALCIATIFSLFGNDPAQLNSIVANQFGSNFPGGGSFQVVYHYIQNFNTEKFQAYDYGYEGNIKRYNQKTPPDYDLKKISAPVALIYGENDALVPVENILELSKRLSNVSVIEAVPYKYFSHMDFVLANDVKKFLYDRIIQLLKSSH